MDEVKCYRCGGKMRWIRRLKIFFCDNDGYIIGSKDAITNGLVDAERNAKVRTH